MESNEKVVETIRNHWRGMWLDNYCVKKRKGRWYPPGSCGFSRGLDDLLDPIPENWFLLKIDNLKRRIGHWWFMKRNWDAKRGRWKKFFN